MALLSTLQAHNEGNAMIRTEAYATEKPLFLMAVGNGKATHLTVDWAETLCGREGGWTEFRGDFCTRCHRIAERMNVANSVDNDTSETIESATQDDDSDKGADMNVQRGRGVVHHTDFNLPICGGNRSSEGYREVSAPVTCKNCLKMRAPVAEVTPKPEPEPVQPTHVEGAEALNVVSVQGGKVHTMMPDAGANPYPLCRGGGMNQGLTKFTATKAPLSCVTCMTYAERRATRLAAEETGQPDAASDTMPTDVATSQVSTHLYESVPEYNMTEMWELCTLTSVESFRETATRILGDRTEVSGKALAAADWSELFAWFTRTDEEDNEMVTKPKKTEEPKPDVDGLLSDVFATIDQIKELDPKGEGVTTHANELSSEAETKIRALPTNRRTALRKAVKEAREAVVSAMPNPEPEPQTVVQVAEDPEEIEGVPQLMAEAVKKAREGVELGVQMGSVSENVARIILNIASLVPNPDTGLPDIMKERKTTKNASAKIYAAARKDVAESDVQRTKLHDSLVKSVQNRNADVLIEWLNAMDSPESWDAFAALYPQAAERVVNAREAGAEDEFTQPSVAIRALYEEKGVELPERGRKEIERERTRAKRYVKAMAELEAAKDRKEDDIDDLDETELTELNSKIEKLEERTKAMAEELPAEAIETVKPKTAQEKTFAKVDQAEKFATAATKGASKLSDDERADLKAKLNELVAKLAAEAAKL